MKIAFLLLMMFVMSNAQASEWDVWQLRDEDGGVLAEICTQPSIGDVYISADNSQHEVVHIEGDVALTKSRGKIELPQVEWSEQEQARPVMSSSRRIAMYCTHSDECYEPSDGYYSTKERGTIYNVAEALGDSLSEQGIEVTLSQSLHHPHDAGAYRRSRQTAVQLLKTTFPDCLIDVHRDGIKDPNSYAVTIGGQKVSKVRLLVGRGNQNAEVNKNFALKIKAVADHVYPGLIKDIYLGKGTFNQDLLPRSILFECGTYTLEKERVFASMPMMAEVLSRTLYGGLVGSVGHSQTDVKNPRNTGGIVTGEPDPPAVQDDSGIGSGIGYLVLLIMLGVAGIAFLSAGSWKQGLHKTGRNLSEMTGGLVGKKPAEGEDHEHS